MYKYPCPLNIFFQETYNKEFISYFTKFRFFKKKTMPMWTSFPHRIELNKSSELLYYRS